MEFTNCKNPVFPPEICIPDSEAHLFNGKLYVYGSLDKTDKEYCSTEYVVASTDDLKTWEISETSFSTNEVGWLKNKKQKHYPIVNMNFKNPPPFFKSMIKEYGMNIDKIPMFLRPESLKSGRLGKGKALLYAPDCAYKNGKYYLYFCLSDSSEGVAVSDSPTGRFENAIQLPCGGIDPAVLVDDDGSAYYFWGQFNASGVKLNDDMVSFDEKEVVQNVVGEEEHGFHEGSSIRKINGKYYFIYPCVYRENRPTCLAYAVSDSPLGKYVYQGIIIDNAKCDPQSWNIHGSIENVNGEWYVFYHRSSKNSKCARRLCVERIKINEDGSIDEVKMTSIGAGEPFKCGDKIEGFRACEVEGGAYVDGPNLVMPKNSSAVFRYVHLQKGVTVKFWGDVSVTALADGKPLSEINKEGDYEITVNAGSDDLTVVTEFSFIHPVA